MKIEQEADYAKMYHRMVQATEKAIDILVAAQRECEELYIRAGERENLVRLYGEKKEE